MLRTFIQMIVIILTLEASYFLLKSNLGLTPHIIARISATRWGGNPDVMKSLSKQCADTKIGLFLIFSAFGIQLVNFFWQMTWDDYAINKVGIIIAILSGIIIFYFGNRISKWLSLKTEKDALIIHKIPVSNNNS